MREFRINNNDAGQRLDKFLTKAVKNLPFSLLYKYIRTKKIKVNGARAAISQRLSAGDTVTLYIKDEFFENGDNNENIFLKIIPHLSVVYEDENILLVNKPRGLVVHADDGKSRVTLIDEIKAYLYRNGEYEPEKEASFAPALCNRIDRNTEGIVICAKNSESLRILNQRIKERSIKKKYTALVFGLFDIKKGRLTNYLYKDSDKNQVFVKERRTGETTTAITEYKVLKENKQKNISLIEATLITGRTHQIRAQFAHIGHPLVGDGKYGKNSENKAFGAMKGQALCSKSVEFLFDGEENLLSYLNGKVFSVKEAEFEKLID